MLYSRPMSDSSGIVSVKSREWLYVTGRGWIALVRTSASEREKMLQDRAAYIDGEKYTVTRLEMMGQVFPVNMMNIGIVIRGKPSYEITKGLDIVRD